MRGTVAKRLRKMARATSTTPTSERWTLVKKVVGLDKDGEKVYDQRGIVKCTGYRRLYQDLKKGYMSGVAV